MKTRVTQTPKGFALPMTILVVVSLLILMIGLIAMLSLERRTARSYSDSARAEMALQSGLADAMSSLSLVASRDDSLVFRLNDPQEPLKTIRTIEREQFFTYGSTFDSASRQWRVIPFFSGTPETLSPRPATGTTARPDSPNTPALVAELRNVIADDEFKALGRLSEMDRSVPRAKWVDLPARTDEHTIRYAWWVEDLAGRIDGRTGGSEPRAKGVNTTELGLYTLFNNSSDTVVHGPQDDLVNKRESLLTAGTSRILISANSQKIEPYLTYSPKPTTTPVEPVPIIPYGFGYADEGRPAMDLNAAVAAGNLQGIADHISRNLPQFVQRKGGLASDDYIKTLAASIIDYADIDTSATSGPGYRGIDSYPLVNELFDRYEWIETSNGTVKIMVETYAELWNMYQKPITGTYRFDNENKVRLKISPSTFHNFTTASYPEPGQPGIPVTLAANEFKVVMMGRKIYEFPCGPFPPTSSGLSFPDTTDNNSYKFHWNDQLVDQAKKARRQYSSFGFGTAAVKWKGSGSPAHDTSIGQEGDPRASWYITAPIFDNNYENNSSWGGRNLKRSVSSGSTYREVKISEWPDRGNDSTAGTTAGNVQYRPTEQNRIRPPAAQPLMAPAFISNLGYYESIGELGNIFDPSQWTNVEAKTAVGNPASGGGYTLAIGRPEFAKFDVPGQRAAQLADLFHVKSMLPVPPQPSAKINLNTAPREVLRTMVAGLELMDDEANSTPARKIFPPKRTVSGDVFADAVIASRNFAPLRGLSDLNLVSVNPELARVYTTGVNEPVLGSTIAYPSASRPTAMWDDAGREETFKRIANLVTFQGKSFRIVVAGEVLDKKLNVVGRSTREIHVMFEPERDSAGNIVPNGKMTTRKLYEKNI